MNDWMIDPPSGWRYGFPMQVTEEQLKDLRTVLEESNYPKDDIDFALKYMRRWKAQKEEE